MKVLGDRLILCFEGAKSTPGMARCLKVYAYQKDAQKKPFDPILGATENYWYRHPIEL